MVTAATERLNMRVSAATNQLIADAADVQGTDKTSFVIEAATSKARRVLLEERALRVTPAEALQIQALLESDSEIPDALRQAAQRLVESGN